MVDPMSHDFTHDRRRRTVLRGIGATAAALGLSGVAAGQDGNETGDGTAGEDGSIPIILAGEATQWVGLAPASILGEENPALELSAGEEYEIVWINIDGEPHNLIFLDENEEPIESSDDSEMAGEAVSMTVEATEEMVEYYCEYHPEDMRASVELDGGFDLSAFDAESNGNESDGE